MTQLPMSTGEHGTRYWCLGMQLSLNQLTIKRR